MLRLFNLLLLMLPAYVANMAPPFVRFWPGWNRPINERWLGAHKTVIGFMAGILAAIVTTYLQARIQARTGVGSSLLNYNDVWLSLGATLGLAAMAGDSLKSFFKRRLGFAPGASWIPFDQLDFVAAALFALGFWIDLTLVDVALVLVLSFIGDVIVNQIAFRLHIRETAW
jgi:CDP-2,3-bis-(O-geranylgeranyl)-sn-glycerol synthase